MPPAAPTVPLTDSASIDDLFSTLGVTYKLDDDSSSTLSPTEADRINRAIGVGTDWVRNRLASLYGINDLAQNWEVWHWATVKACYWLCIRRGQSPPAALAIEVENAEDVMKAVCSGSQILDIPLAWTNAPSFSNFRLDGRYHERQMRLQADLSDSTPVYHNQNRDTYSVINVEPSL